jgi:2-phospho-L-lactate guanylyltransferase
VASAARALGATVVDDVAESSQSAAAAVGVERALADRIERVLCVPGDCPALDPAELDQLLGERGRAPEVVIVPDRHGAGTNGLLLWPPNAIEPSFGPGSCARHTALARAAGVSCRLAHPRSLLLDIDTGADLAALRERLTGPGALATHTRAVLGRHAPSDAVTLTGRA